MKVKVKITFGEGIHINKIIDIPDYEFEDDFTESDTHDMINDYIYEYINDCMDFTWEKIDG